MGRVGGGIVNAALPTMTSKSNDNESSDPRDFASSLGSGESFEYQDDIVYRGVQIPDGIDQSTIEHGGDPLFRSVPVDAFESGGGIDLKSAAISPSLGGLASHVPHSHCIDAKPTDSCREAKLPDPPVVPPSPFFLEKDSHEVAQSPATLFQCINAALSMLEVDAKFVSQDFKFHCTAYPNFNRVDFVIAVYQKSSVHTALVVEFQRRSGCTLSYRHLLQGLRNALRLDSGRRALSYFGPPVMDLDDEDLPPLKSADLEPVVGMVSSEYIDVQREGAKILVPVVENPAAIDAVLESGLVRAVVHAIERSDDPEVMRCSACALGKFVSKTDERLRCKAAKAVINAGGVDALLRLAACGPSIEALEVQRQASFALCQLARDADARSRILGRNGKQTMMSVVQASRCSRLQKVARETMLLLEAR